MDMDPAERGGVEWVQGRSQDFVPGGSVADFGAHQS